MMVFIAQNYSPMGNRAISEWLTGYAEITPEQTAGRSPDHLWRALSARLKPYQVTKPNGLTGDQVIFGARVLRCKKQPRIPHSVRDDNLFWGSGSMVRLDLVNNGASSLGRPVGQARTRAEWYWGNLQMTADRSAISLCWNNGDVYGFQTAPWQNPIEEGGNRGPTGGASAGSVRNWENCSQSSQFWQVSLYCE